MTLQEILNDETLRHREFPVTQKKIFLAHAAVCPLPRRVTCAMEEYIRSAQGMDQEAVLEQQLIQRVRQAAAGLLNAESGEIALVGPTSLALSFIAGGLAWEKGDNILVYRDDYPSNVYPWMALEEKGVEVRFLSVPQLGRITLENIEPLVDARTRLVALASCHFISGYRLDVAGIGRYLQEQGILFCLDAIQTLGAFPTTVEQVDFLAADAHKWMLGPCAAGLLFVRKERLQTLRPTVFGWHNVRCPGFVAQEHLELRTDARRYEAGTANLIGLVGLEASLALLQEIGIDQIKAELLRKRAWMAAALQEKGYSILESDVSSEHASAILSFHRTQTDLSALYQHLADRDIITSLRTDRTGQQYIRLSPHFYNTDAELGRFIEMV